MALVTLLAFLPTLFLSVPAGVLADRCDRRLHRMGFVFQQMNMMANLNLLDNILLPAVHANSGKNGRSKAELTEKAESLMKKQRESTVNKWLAEMGW